MTYEQLEYVARAIFCADARGTMLAWLAIDQDHRNYYMRLAKAAADAMPRSLIPTEPQGGNYEDRHPTDGIPQTSPAPVEAIRAAVTLLDRKITKLSWSRDECRRKGQDVYVSNLTMQINELDGYYHALISLAGRQLNEQRGTRP